MDSTQDAPEVTEGQPQAEEQAPVEPEGEAVAEGTPEAEPESSAIAEALAGLSGSEFDRVYESMSDEERSNSAVIQEVARRSREEGRAEAELELRNQQASKDFYASLTDLGREAQRYLEEAQSTITPQFERLTAAIAEGDTDAAQEAAEIIQSIIAGDDYRAAIHLNRVSGVAEAQSMARDEMAQWLKQRGSDISELSADTIKALADARAIDQERARTKGEIGNAFLFTLTDALIAQAEARGEQKGIEKGRRVAAADSGLAERIEKIASGKVGSEPNGLRQGATTPAPMSRAAFEALPLDEQAKVPQADRARIYQEDALARQGAGR